MAELSEQMKLACLRWQAKCDFEIACHPLGEKENTTRIQINGTSFVFYNCTSPFNPASVPLVADSKILFYQSVLGSLNFPSDIKLSRSVAYYAPNNKHSDNRTTYRNLGSLDDIVQDVNQQFSYPLVVKPDQGRCGRNVVKTDTPEQTRQSLMAIFEEEPLAIVQDYISLKKEFRAHIFDGEAVIIYEKNSDKATPNGNLNPIYWDGSQPVVSKDPRLQDQCDRLAQHMLENLNFVHAGLDIGLDVNGDTWLIEANASPMGLSRLEEYAGSGVVEQLTDKMMVKMIHQSGCTP